MINDLVPSSVQPFWSLGENQITELEEFTSLARAHLSSRPEGERVRKDFIEDQLRLVREGVRDVRLHDVTCDWVTRQPKYQSKW